MRRTFSLKHGHILGILEEGGIPLVRFEESEHLLHVHLSFMGHGEYGNVFVEDVNEGKKKKISSDEYHLKSGERVYFGENVSILMSRLNDRDFRITVKTEEAIPLFIQKGKFLLRTGLKEETDEHTFKLYDISESNQQRW